MGDCELVDPETWLVGMEVQTKDSGSLLSY